MQEVEPAEEEVEEVAPQEEEPATGEISPSEGKEQAEDTGEETTLPPVIKPTVQDREDDKWTNFPDISFPSAQSK